jgi:hypothetical protein
MLHILRVAGTFCCHNQKNYQLQLFLIKIGSKKFQICYKLYRLLTYLIITYSLNQSGMK